MSFQGGGGGRVNISAQDLDYMIVRHGLGTTEAATAAGVSIPPLNTHDFVDYTGKGYVYYYLAYVVAANNSQLIAPRIEIDGVNIRPGNTFANHSANGFNKDTVPLKLMKYGVNGVCVAMYFFNPALAYDTTLKLTAKNYSTTTTQSVMGEWFYTKI